MSIVVKAHKNKEGLDLRLLLPYRYFKSFWHRKKAQFEHIWYSAAYL
jgi:hypothetical protein